MRLVKVESKRPLASCSILRQTCDPNAGNPDFMAADGRSSYLHALTSVI